MSEERKVYVVMGGTGEYSDRREWPVAAYLDKAMADAHEDAAVRWARAHGLGFDADLGWEERRDRPPSPFDPGMHVDYTGTDYHVLEVPLRDALPAVESTP